MLHSVSRLRPAPLEQGIGIPGILTTERRLNNGRGIRYPRWSSALLSMTRVSGFSVPHIRETTPGSARSFSVLLVTTVAL